MYPAGLKFITSERNNDRYAAKFFCAFHPDNQKIALEIMHDVTSVCDCTVFYYENGNRPSPEYVFEDDLSQMSLFIMIVSSDYLSSGSFARDVVFAYATDHMIPVLPIVTEPGLENPFNNIMGNLQFILLNNEQYNITAVPYLEKLKNHLTQFIASEKSRKDLRSAFDASVFLSYRKKDRYHAQKLMDMIHSDEKCRGFSIWYDEFLVPGEDFNDGIQEELESCSMVILAVTPHITEKNNYIVLTEYPAAVTMGKTIVPFEMCHTSRKELAAHYPQFPNLIPAKKAAVVIRSVLKTAEKLGIQPLETTAEKEYLRGLAYLKGICVEKNLKIGAEKVLAAAKGGVPQAMQTLVAMYQTGEGVSRSLADAEFWQKQYIKTLPDDSAEPLAKAYFELGEIYEQSIHYDAAIEAYETVTALCASDPLLVEFFATASIKAGLLYLLQGERFLAKGRCFQPALEARKQQYGNSPSVEQRISLCELYALLAECCEMSQDRPGVKNYAVLMKNTLPSADSAEGLSFSWKIRLLTCNNKLCHFYVTHFDDKDQEAFIFIGESIRIAERLVDISDCYTSRIQLILAHMNNGDLHADKKVENHLRAAEEAYAAANLEAAKASSKYGFTLEMSRTTAQLLQKQAFVKLGLGQAQLSAMLYDIALSQFRQVQTQLDSLLTRKNLSDCLQEACAAYEQQGADPEDIAKALLESIALSQKNRAESYLAVYQKDEAAAHRSLAKLYQAQWDMDNAFYHAKQQIDLLRQAMQGTRRVLEMKLFASALEQALPIARLAGEFDAHSDWQAELAGLIAKYEMFL